VLELEYTHVAIHKESGAYVVLSAEEVHSVKTSRRHLLQYPTVRKDVNTSCVMALYKNLPGLVKRLCTYLVRPTTMIASVERLDTHFFYLRKVPKYSIQCHLTVHHEQLEVNKRLIHYRCNGECGVNLQSFNRSDFIWLSKTNTGFESWTCRFISPDMVIPFTLLLTGAVQRNMSLSRYFNILVILHSNYTEIELEGITGATSYVEPTNDNIPKISVEFLDTDQGTRLELETVLNQTDQGLRVYASYWQDPVFLKSCSDLYDVSLLGINVLTMLVCAIIFICQQRNLVRIQAMIVVLQARRVPQAAGLELFRLVTTSAPTKAPGKSHTEMIVEFSNTYWLILFGLFVAVHWCHISLRVNMGCTSVWPKWTELIHNW